MPTLDSNDLETLRTFPHEVKRYLSVQPKRVVFAARVNGSPVLDAQSGGVHSFAFDGVVSGVYTNVEVGETITIGTTPLGDDIGTTRVRKLPTSNTMYVAETALAKLNVVDNAYITVYEQYQPWSKLPRLVAVKNKASYTNSFTEYHDYDIVYSNQNTQIAPVANITVSPTSRKAPKPADWLDEGEDFRTVTFSSAFSYAVATGATIVSRSWEVDDGTIEGGVPTNTNVTVTFPPGFRVVTLIVVDSNGKTTYRHYPIWAHDPELFPPITEAGFSVNSDVRDEGREMAFDFFGQDDSLSLPEGTAVCYWEDAEFGDEEPPEQYIDSFLGWTLSTGETLKLNDTSTYRITVGGIQTWLSEFTGFATTISDVATVNRWFKMNNITVDRIALYVLREYSTALLVANFYPTGITTTVKAEEIKKSDIWNQVSELQKGNQYSSVIADSLNSIWCRRHYDYMELDERADVDIVINLNPEDWTDEQGLTIDEQELDKVSVVTGSGSFVGNNKNRLIYSKAPGLVPALSGGDEEAPFQRLPHVSNVVGFTGQDRLNKFTGHHFARVNNRRSEVSLELIGNYDIIESAWGEPITLTWLSPSLLDEGTILNSAEFLVNRVSVSHSNEYGQAPKTITWTLEEATIGEPGLTYTPPKSNTALSLGTITFPKISLPTIQPFEWLSIPPSVPTLAAIQLGADQGGGIYRNSVYIADYGDIASPQFTERTFSLSSEQLQAFTADPYSPYYVGTGSTVNGWANTGEGIWRISDVFADPSAGQALQFTWPDRCDGLEAARIVASRIRQSWLIAINSSSDLVAGPGNGHTDVMVTLDGINWTQTLTIGFSGNNPIDFLHMSERVPGLVYVGSKTLLWRSFDYGLTWELISGLDRGHWVHVPKHDNPQENNVWYAYDGAEIDGNAPPPENPNTLYRFNVNVTPSFINGRELPLPGSDDEVFYVRNVFQSSKNPGRIFALCIKSPDFRIPSVSSRAYVSINAGITWKEAGFGGGIQVQMAISDSNPDYITIWGDQEADPPFNVGYPNAGKGFIVSTRNFGKTFEDRSGNLLTLNPGGVATQTSRIVAVVGS